MSMVTRSLGGSRPLSGTLVWWAGYLGVIFGGIVLAFLGRSRLDQPFLAMTLAILVLLVTLWFIRPTLALYSTLFLGMIGDNVTAAWFPFNKYLSSEVSMSFLVNGLSISPLEISIGVGLVVTSMHRYSVSGRLQPHTAMLRPVLVFGAFVVVGFVRVILTRSDLRIAILEGRGLVYLVAMFLIATNVCTERANFRRAIWAVLAGSFVHSLFSLEYLARLPAEKREALESLVEHGAVLPMNLLALVFIASVMFRDMPRWVTVASGVLLLPVATVYLVSQRRAAIASLCVAIVLMCLVLLWRQPRTFFRVVPLLGLVVAGYVGAFWNSESTAGFPAQAVKSVIAPGQAAEEDRGSDQYRIFENIDVNFTIRAAPLHGIGFGKPFYRPIPLPAIADFTLARYVPHNSILWIWVKLGFFGFVSMLYLIVKALMLGTHRARTERDGLDMLVPLLAMLYIAMYTIYTFVDISWDARNTPLLGLALAICAFEPTARSTPQDTDSSEAGSELSDASPPDQFARD